MKRLIQASFLAAAVLLSGSAFAADWVVARVTAPAKYSTNGTNWKTVENGMAVPNSAWINTGEGGRVLLRRGADTMLINAYTLVAAVEKGSSNHPVTTLHQKFGEMTVDVEKRGYDQMTVQTPFMAAIVKGTRFTVTGTKLASTLSVARGLVEVANTKTGQKAYVGAGGKAQIGATDNSVELSGSNASLVTSSTNGKATGIANQAGATGIANSANANAGAGNNNAGGNSDGAGNSGNSNAGGNSGNSNAGAGNNNAGGNSNGAGNSENSNAGGNN